MTQESLDAKITEFARLYPGKVAIKSTDQSISYLDLERKSNRIANFMHGKIKKIPHVIIILDRSPELIESIIGLLKCGLVFVPLGNIIAPIVIWQMKKHESEFVVDQAKESLNFQITIMIYALISFLLFFIFIGIFLIFALVIFSLIVVIIAGLKANEGEYYRYPMCIRLISQKKYPQRT